LKITWHEKNLGQNSLGKRKMERRADTTAEEEMAVIQTHAGVSN
jgi:hypothetical protein